MIITKEILNEKVPSNMFPTRLDSAMNLYTYINNKGLVLYNVNPDTWNCLYPFFELNHKFTINNYNFENTDITYKELILEYQKQYNLIHEIKNGYTKEKRKEILLSEYKRTFNLDLATIADELESFYELKYSKSMNVWTLYYFENYVVNKVNDLNVLLSQTLYQQEFIPLDYKFDKVNNTSIVENTLYLISNDENTKLLEKNGL